MVDKLIEIRAWPQQADLRVIDVLGARQIAHYPVDFGSEYPLANPQVPYPQRAERAREILQNDQQFLQMTFGVDQDVNLQIDPRPRQLINDLLVDYQLDLEALELANSKQLLAEIEARFDQEQLFSLLVDWYDLVEEHRYRGYSQQRPAAWIQRSAPENCFLFHYLSQGFDGRADFSPEQDQRAHNFFQQLIDVPAGDYSFGLFLRWLYYSRSEFPDLPRQPLSAWEELKIDL
jgi:hypothetical protein